MATLTLDSPPNRNALSTALIEELLAALAAADADDSVRAIVLTHTGPVFSSGADLKETAAAIGSGRPPITRLGDVLAAIWEGRKPVVARVAGPARAGGLGLIAAADIAVCSTDATFAFTEVRIGVVPAVISATVLPRLSSRDAAELYLTGATFDGARAERVGLVTAAVAPEELDAAVAAYVAALVRGAPEALAGTKELLRQPRTDRFRHQIRALTEISVSYFGSDEGREGMLAFREKRDPNWVPDGAA
ncbi:enoyl-CoA hydratase family protein [Dactylosporangium matsuzakiense]|uniref:Enoyl-CoA hydratase n=1 Tax=Dactylosporangium matsuzakiense TaxID=53360 RepID=A0A9W6KSM5_9ACTN|nr:enoyl-CoA hydratase [Dactylosporangium matsuzakiense]